MSTKTFPRICCVVRDVMDLGDDIVLARNTVLSDLEIEDSELADLRDGLENEFEITILDKQIEELPTMDDIDALVRKIYLGEDEEGEEFSEE